MDGRTTKRHRARLAREQGGLCTRCRRPIPAGTGELHHIDGNPGNDEPSNLTLVHAACNPRGGGLHKQ
jgi:5-methylcytosine-specific restriction endonuclease McrA